ncbi:MAG: hypothetical protein ACRD6X_12745 [Pyrinomonadaceae bacterium]
MRNSKVIQDNELEPLTRTTRAGETLRRRFEVEEQIKEALALDAEALEQRLSVRDYWAAGFIKPEAIVYLIRRSLDACDEDSVNRLSTALVGQLTRMITGKVRILSPNLREDCHSEIVVRVFEEIVDLSTNRADYAQVSFGDWLEKRALDSIRKCWKENTQSQITDSLTSEDEGSDEDAAGPEGRDFRSSALRPEEYGLFIDKALSVLKDNEREAFIMRHFWEWEIENADPSIPTISTRFVKSARTIRNWLASADKKIKTWRDRRGT